MLQLYANNAKTTLAAAITSTQTSITVAPGTGSLFPTPVPGTSWFTLTLTSATSPSVYEITYCTSRSGDTLTVLRGQEGTTAQPFNLNDIAGNYDTAYVMENLIQVDQWQDNTYGLATAGGTVNALTATIPSNFTSIPNGMQIILLASGANTGPATLQLTLGSTITSALPIIKGNNAPLIAGDIPLAGYPLTLIYSSTLSAWVITDIAINLSPYATLLSPAFTGTPTAPTPAINNNSTDIATTAYVQNNLANYAPLFSPAFSGSPVAPTPAINNNSTEIATTAYVQNNLANYAPLFSPNFTGTPEISGYPILTTISEALSQDGYVRLSNGLIIQWGVTPLFYNESGQTIYFTQAFPNAIFVANATINLYTQISGANDYWAQVYSLTTTSMGVFCQLSNAAATNFPINAYWIAIGH